MKWIKMAPGIVLAGLALSAVRVSAQTVQTFEDLSKCDNRGFVGVYGPVNYADWTCFGFTFAPFTPHSPTNRVYTFDTFAPFSFINSTAKFNGAWFSGQPTSTVFFQMFLNNTLVGTSQILTTSSEPAFLSSGYAGQVDMVKVVSVPGPNSGPGYYIMDDVTFSNLTTVPEPASMVLLGTGLMGLTTFGRFRRRKT